MTNYRQRVVFRLGGLFVALLMLLVVSSNAAAANWRAATEAELKTVIPARAPVGTERIETELGRRPASRTARASMLPAWC